MKTQDILRKIWRKPNVSPNQNKKEIQSTKMEIQNPRGKDLFMHLLTLRLAHRGKQKF